MQGSYASIIVSAQVGLARRSFKEHEIEKVVY
jgi:hypothetical protein